MTPSIAQRARDVRTDNSQGTHVTIVPLLGPSHDEQPYALLSPDVSSKVQVSEISEHGSVPQLRVFNDLDVRVYLMDGQQLIGAKQNRILNTDVLVAANSTTTIPVSCVEQGRWRFISRTFQSSDRSANFRTRSSKSARVYDSLKRSGKHDADQRAVWEDVAKSLHDTGVTSATMALSDAYNWRHEELRRLRDSLRLPSEAVGVAAFHGARFLGLDLFDRHSTLEHYWNSLLDSYGIDMLNVPDRSKQTEAAQGHTVQAVLERIAAGKWERFDSPGEGDDWRLNDAAYCGEALVWDDRVVVHLQVFPKDGEASRE